LLFSEETQIIFEKKLNKKLFTEFVEYVEFNGLINNKFPDQNIFKDT